MALRSKVFPDNTMQDNAPAASRALVLLASVLTLCIGVSCAQSPYRDALRDMKRPASERLAQRVSDVAQDHVSARNHFESTRADLNTAKTASASDNDANRERILRDSVDRCRWWIFNLERRALSVQDIADELVKQSPEVAARYEQFQESLDTSIDRMTAAADDFEAAFQALNFSTQSNSAPPGSVPDLPALDELGSAVNSVMSTSVALKVALDASNSDEMDG